MNGCTRLHLWIATPYRGSVAKDRHTTPRRVIGIEEPVWKRLLAMYGQRNRADVLRQAAAWLARMPGAKLPTRPPVPGDDS